MLDPHGRVSSWNAGAQRIKGYRPDEIIGEHFSRFYTPEDRAGGLPQKALDAAIAHGRYEKEGQRIRKDGSRFWASVVIDAIRNDAGRLIGFAKVTRDITERREAQRELEQARESLFQSQKIEALGQLTGGVAHDFNNLLMAVLGSLEIVKRRLPYDPRVTPLVENAIEGANRGAALTQRMLAFARRQELMPVPLDIPTVIRGMTGLLQRSLGSHVSIDTRFPLALDHVCADVTQLEMSLLNLAVNARDAMPNGGTIVIAARKDSVGPGHLTGLHPGDYICLSVADTGIGMDAETLKSGAGAVLHDQGRGQGHRPRSVDGAWHGRGNLAAGSCCAAGSVKAPRPRSGCPRSTTRSRPLPKAEQPRLASVGQQRIVYVDDDRLVLMNTVLMLEDLGHKVFAATSGAEALEILAREGDIDLLITDQIMPQMTGVQLLQKVAAARPSLPVILATGYAELPASEELQAVRLSKPFLQEDLARAIFHDQADKRPCHSVFGPLADPAPPGWTPDSPSPQRQRPPERQPLQQ
jgi:PAS domain S-box-containing protein